MCELSRCEDHSLCMWALMGRTLQLQPGTGFSSSTAESGHGQNMNCELQRVQGGADHGAEMGEDEPLHGLHQVGGQCSMVFIRWEVSAPWSSSGGQCSMVFIRRGLCELTVSQTLPQPDADAGAVSLGFFLQPCPVPPPWVPPCAMAVWALTSDIITVRPRHGSSGYEMMQCLAQSAGLSFMGNTNKLLYSPIVGNSS
uniref:Uncharacterized protein n=1 Tax=Knipowitschia caucasica TaxID=637954 RepID=A0AAV2KVS0_KNICA